MVSTPILWICLVALLFWSFYEKFDAKRSEYTDHPLGTTFYFLFASSSIILLYPNIWKLFSISPLSLFIVIFVLMVTYTIYKILPKHYVGPKDTFCIGHKYWSLLNPKYILPKFFEIMFQQVFFASVLILVISNLDSDYAFLIGTSLFIIAHIPLFFLLNARVGKYYLFWSILGAPVFAYVIVTTGQIWYSIAIHMLFYTTLSTVSWMVSPKKN